MSMANWWVHVIDPIAVISEEARPNSIDIVSELRMELVCISFTDQAALDAFKAEINKIVVS